MILTIIKNRIFKLPSKLILLGGLFIIVLSSTSIAQIQQSVPQNNEGNVAQTKTIWDRLFQPAFEEEWPQSKNALFLALQADGIVHKENLHKFYTGQKSVLLWSGSEKRRDNASVMMTQIRDAWTHGLNPDNYHYETLKTLHSVIQKRGRMRQAEGAKIRFDVLLSDAFMHYLKDMTGARATMHESQREYWQSPLDFDALLTALHEDAAAFQVLLKAHTPKTPLYKSLQQDLIDIVSHQQYQSELFKQALFFKGIIKGGDTHPVIPDIRRYFGLPQKAQGENEKYDSDLVARIRAFQTEKGLRVDGIIGQNTLYAMGVFEDVPRFINSVANLERLRWLNHDYAERYILVNVPEKTLWAIEDNKARFSTKVIVGKPSRKTESFHAKITGVRFNPNWTVPTTIKKKDFLPKLREDPTYLNQIGIDLYKRGEDGLVSVDSTIIDWQNIGVRDLHQLVFRQPPGAYNPLGLVRVLMTNKYNIYLHDTNKPELFGSESLALSSGCIRMEDPQKVAAFIMEANEGWSDQYQHSIIERGALKNIRTAAPLPVYITYITARYDPEKGQALPLDDIYDWDTVLTKKLADTGGIYLPSQADLDQIASKDVNLGLAQSDLVP